MTYVGRYAPSPTGDLHLGNVLAALVAYVRAKHKSGQFILRMDDLDTPRVKDASAARITDDLHWLGFRFDKLPWSSQGFYTQSFRSAAYDKALSLLAERGRVFACRCSRKDIQAASAPHGPSPVYPGTCSRLGLPFDGEVSWRFVPDEGAAVPDKLCGPFVQSAQEIGEFVVRRRDKIPAYHLACVVDDAAQGVTEVVRGRDLLESTPRQVALYRALSLRVPAFAHGPLLVDQNGRRLAKRDGDLTLRSLRAQGVLPSAVWARLWRSISRQDCKKMELHQLVSACTDAHFSQEHVVLRA